MGVEVGGIACQFVTSAGFFRRRLCCGVMFSDVLWGGGEGETDMRAGAESPGFIPIRLSHVLQYRKSVTFSPKRKHLPLFDVVNSYFCCTYRVFHFAETNQPHRNLGMKAL